MFDAHFFIIVLSAAVAGYAAGSIWFSPLLFMKSWMYALGKTKEATVEQMPRVMTYGFINTLGIAFALAVLIELTGVATLAQYFQIVFFILFAFIATTKFNDLIYASHEPHWTRKPQILFLVNLGYYIFSYSIMTLVLWFGK
jgi:hypothetical protein